jgi:hypothetical protein
MKTEIRELDTAELDAVSGGMRWTRGVKNDDVIDRRAEGAILVAAAGAIAGAMGGAGPK